MTSSDSDNSVVTAKAVAMSCLFLASMILGTLPIKLSQWLKWKSNPKSNVYVQMLLCFGGGVLLCTTFVHLLPEVEENIEGANLLPSTHLPLAQLLMCAGFFIMYFVEECVHLYLHKREHRQFETARRSISISRANFDSNQSDDSLIKGQYAHGHDSHADHSHADHSHVDHSHVDHSHVGHSHVAMSNSTIITIRGLLIVLALSIHELFEGLAVGLEGSASHVWYMFGAVSAHKFVIAFCIGVELVTSGMTTLLVVIYVFTFAVVSPLGIGIGIAITEENDATVVPSVILQGLATGTLLYVVYFEILREERKSGIRQFFAVLVGFLVMLGLTFLESD